MFEVFTFNLNETETKNPFLLKKPKASKTPLYRGFTRPAGQVKSKIEKNLLPEEIAVVFDANDKPDTIIGEY